MNIRIPDYKSGLLTTQMEDVVIDNGASISRGSCFEWATEITLYTGTYRLPRKIR